MTLLTLRHLHGSRQLAMFASLKQTTGCPASAGRRLMGYFAAWGVPKGPQGFL